MASKTSSWGRSALLVAILATGTLAGLAGCNNPSVRYDYDAHTNYSSYKTYDWQDPQQGVAARGGGFDNPIMTDRVLRAVDKELAAKGFRREASADPDFLVIYAPLREASRAHQVHLGLGFGFGPLGLGVAAPVGDPHREAVGAIVLEVQDFKTRTVVWKATADDALEGSDSPAEADSDVADAVHTMLKSFPPGR
jgi:hypothetical protein